MDCPSCGQPTRTLETRRADGGVALRRRRECSACGHRFTTFERSAPEPIHVRKRDGSLERFDPAKLRAALTRACHKRDVDPRKIDLVVGEVERAARSGRGGELSAAAIGELCLRELEPLDRGAFLQFAGTLPDDLAPELGNSRNRAVSSVRDGEDAPELPPETGSERTRGEI